MMSLAKLALPSLPGVGRLLSTLSIPAAAATLEGQLATVPWIQLLPIPGAGRGLFAARDIEQGVVVHEEAPMLCAPSPHALDATCRQCLRPLVPGSAHKHSIPAAGSSMLPFCSNTCHVAAQGQWASAAAACDFGPLQQACKEAGEKFPFMLTRLACLQIQRQQQQQQDNNGSSCSSASLAGQTAAATEAAEQEEPARGDPLSQLRHLCYANIFQPPQPWVEMHRLLLQGLQPLAGRSTDSSSRSDDGCSSSSSISLADGWLQRQFSLEWFCNGMARLHLNSFRVDTVPPLSPSDPSALLRAAAASLASSSAPAHHTGSAVYLLASMFNHSCEPNLDVSFPRNNAVVTFTAARDVASNEQLTISYVDVGMPLQQRRQALQFGYGFTCGCPRCVEEEQAESDIRGPAARQT